MAYCRDRALEKLEQRTEDISKLESELLQKDARLGRMCEQLAERFTYNSPESNPPRQGGSGGGWWGMVAPAPFVGLFLAVLVCSN